MSPRSNFITSSAPSRWTNGRCSDYRATESRNLRTQLRANNDSRAHQSRDQVLTRDDTDQISFLIDDRGQAKPRSPQSLDGARGRFTFLDRDHSPDIAANRPRVVSIEQNIDHIHQTDRIAVGSDHG